jgi:molybdopterin molybdotransferase
MKEFFKVTDLQTVLEYRTKFPQVKTEEIPLVESVGRILAKDMVADDDLPDFPRAIVDGYAVKGASTFGSSESNPAYLTLCGSIAMGESPEIAVGPGEAAQIATGGMLPPGADSVVMIEHTEAIDDTTIEVYRSVAPGQNMIAVGEDIKKQSLPQCRSRPEHDCHRRRYQKANGCPFERTNDSPPGGRAFSRSGQTTGCRLSKTRHRYYFHRR